MMAFFSAKESVLLLLPLLHSSTSASSAAFCPCPQGQRRIDNLSVGRRRICGSNRVTYLQHTGKHNNIVVRITGESITQQTRGKLRIFRIRLTCEIKSFSRCNLRRSKATGLDVDIIQFIVYCIQPIQNWLQRVEIRFQFTEVDRPSSLGATT